MCWHIAKYKNLNTRTMIAQYKIYMRVSLMNVAECSKYRYSIFIINECCVYLKHISQLIPERNCRFSMM